VYVKVHWIFLNPPRKPQSHQNSDFLGTMVLSSRRFGNDDIHQNSDFLRELSLSAQTGAFLLGFLFRASLLPKAKTSHHRFYKDTRIKLKSVR